MTSILVTFQRKDFEAVEADFSGDDGGRKEIDFSTFVFTYFDNFFFFSGENSD